MTGQCNMACKTHWHTAPSLALWIAAAFLAAVPTGPARAIQFWNSLEHCRKMLSRETLVESFEGFDWQDVPASEDRLLQHNAHFRLHFQLAWMGESDEALITLFDQWDQFIAKESDRKWDFVLTDPAHDAVLTVLILDGEQICMITAARPLVPVLSRTASGHGSLRDAQIGSFAKGEAMIISYNQTYVLREMRRRLNKQFRLSHPFFAIVSTVDAQ